MMQQMFLGMGGDPAPGGPFSVSGGNANNTSGGYKYFYFTSGGALEVRNDGDSGPFPMSFMLLGEGGQGGSTGGGGGAAAAFVQKIDYLIEGVPSSQVNWPVTIRTTSAPVPDGSTGANSDFQIPTISKTFVSAGGGGGGPGPGGSAGAGGGRNDGNGGTPGVGSLSDIDSDGNTPDVGIRGTGGAGLLTASHAPPGGGGGGGAGAGGNGVDATGSPNVAGKGGLGRAAFLGDTGVASSYGTTGPGPGRWFAGGGGGGQHDSGSAGAASDAGGGGAGGPNSPSPVSGGGQDGMGAGGGGGGGLANAFPGPVAPSGGGSGILIVRVPTSILT